MCNCAVSPKKIRHITEDLLFLFCEKNSDGTKNLRLKGNELSYRMKLRVKDKDMELISKFILSNQQIIRLDLPYNEIGDTGIDIFTKSLLLSNPNNNLRHLNLMGCNITADGIETLCDAWSTIKLITLRLTGNKLGSDSGPALGKLLLKVPSLELFDVADTDQTVVSIPYYSSALRSDIGGNNTLKVLDISNVIPLSKYYQVASSNIAEQIGTMLKMNTTLVEMHMQKCNMDGHDVELLLLGVRKNRTLLMLDIGYNCFGNFGAELLARWLSMSPILMGLNIAGCGIGEHGGRALSFGVPFSNLRLLDLSQNVITDQGMSEFLKSIKKEHPIRNLFIWGNELGPESMPILERQVMGEVYEQEHVDFKLYRTPEGLHVSRYPANVYKHRFYCQLERADVQELRVRRNNVESDFCSLRAKIKFNHYDRVFANVECLEDVRNSPRYDEDRVRARCEQKQQQQLLTKKRLEDEIMQGMAAVECDVEECTDFHTQTYNFPTSETFSKFGESLVFCPDILIDRK